MKKPLQTVRCKACGQEILFIPTRLYKKCPVDAEPVYVVPSAEAENIYVTPDGGTIRGYEIGNTFDDEQANIRLAYVSHFATCTNPGRFRRRNDPTMIHEEEKKC